MAPFIMFSDDSGRLRSDFDSDDGQDDLRRVTEQATEQAQGHDSGVPDCDQVANLLLIVRAAH